MNPIFRTLVFVAVAAVSAGTAWFTNWATQPATLEGFELTGEEFYPKFTNPLKAAKLRVAAYDDRRQQPVEFEVRKVGDVWIIPSHHNYPAEAKDRLAETAASLLGVTRNAVAGRTEADHERLGVVDPLDEESATESGRGRRITLSGKSDEILVDLIIGNAAKDRQNEYFVRRPDEKETYRANLEVKLSTKFAEWIEPDLLKLDAGDLVTLSVATDPVIDETGRLVKEEISRIDRVTSSDPWKLEGLDEEKEELNEDDVREMVNALDDLKILGVRSKPQGITSEFMLDPPDSIRNNPLEIMQFQRSLVAELRQKGFDIVAGQDDQSRLISLEGEVTAFTDEGVVYHLHFGREFTGTIEEIEIGGAKKSGKDSKKDDSARNESSTSGKQSRYLFVRVDFKEPPVPDKPVKPEEPAKLQGPAGADDGPKPESDDGGQAPKEDQPAVAKKDGEPTEKEKEDAAKAEYEQALRTYEEDLRKYETDLKDHDDKVEAGKKTAKNLNARFADWYYVISGENFEKLRLTRSGLVKAKDKPETEEKPGEDGNIDPKPDTDDGSPGSTQPKTAPSDPKEADPKPDGEDKENNKSPSLPTPDETTGKPAGGNDESANKPAPSNGQVEKKPQPR